MKDYDIELNKLNEVVLKYGEVINDLESLINGIPSKYKTDEKSLEIYNNLSRMGLKINYIAFDDSSYDSSVCVLSSELAKGLEFDSVIIADASEDKYSSTNKCDMKNLYVAMTRALHELKIIYVNELTKPLREW